MTTTETAPHRCRDCPRCPSRALTDPRDSVTCNWDCGCPDYPPPEVQALQKTRAAGTWRDRAPRSVTDPNDSQGHPVPTPTDRRWLWRLEGFLAVSGTNDVQRQMGRDLAEYLNETCEHHFIHLPADDCCGEARQCTWCHLTEWKTAEGWAA